MTDAEESGGAQQMKVEHVMKEYDLPELKAELEARWSAPDGERDSLRDLARYVNEGILEAALDRAGVNAIAGEVENYYRLLADEEVSAGRRAEARSTLEQHDIDVNAVEKDFVSHQAVHTFLTERAGVSYEGISAADRLRNAREAMARLEGRVQSVAERNVEELAGADHLEVGNVSVLVSLDVVCNDCGERYDFEALLEAGGFDCADGKSKPE